MRTRRRKKKEEEEVYASSTVLCNKIHSTRNLLHNLYKYKRIKMMSFTLNNYQALCNRCPIMRRRRIINLFAIAAP